MKSMHVNFLLFFLLGLFSCACETDIATGEPTDEAREPAFEPTPNTVDDSNSSSPAFVALDLVNNLRTKGCKCGTTTYAPTTPLSLDNRLMTAARNHSADMAANKKMQHKGTDGSNVGDRATKAGFTWRAVAENVAWNQRDVAAVVAAWKDSPGHCKNIMSPSYTHMGYADVDRYYTQVFAAGR